MLNLLNNTSDASPISARNRAAARPLERPMAADYSKEGRSISKRHEGPPQSALAVNTIIGEEEKADDLGNCEFSLERSKTLRKLQTDMRIVEKVEDALQVLATIDEIPDQIDVNLKGKISQERTSSGASGATSDAASAQ